jgi:hypothetical protein
MWTHVSLEMATASTRSWQRSDREAHRGTRE